MRPGVPRRIPTRVLVRLLVALALTVAALWLGLPRQPLIARPPLSALIARGSVVTQDFVWKPPYPILRLAQVRQRADTGVLVLTAEEPRGPQPLRSHLYLISPDVPGRVKELSPEPDYNFWDLSVGDVDGDGGQDVALCTWSQTARDSTYARRFFVYGWDQQGDLTPLWRGSQLCRPYLTAALADVTGDAAAELVSVVRALSGRLIVVAYAWNQFGFWGLGHTEEYDAISTVTPLHGPDGRRGLQIRGRQGWHLRDTVWQPAQTGIDPVRGE